MNGAAASELVLALACAAIIWRHAGKRPGIVVAVGLIGAAAALGTVRLSGLDVLLGPHRFAAMLAACAGFPLLGFSIRYPDDPIAAQAAGAGRFVVLLGGLGAVVTMAGVAAWGPALSLIAVLAVLWTLVSAREAVGIAGAAIMLAVMLATLVGRHDLFNPAVVLHLGLAAGLTMVCLHGAEFKQRSIASPSPRG